jgi:hypothetical protein
MYWEPDRRTLHSCLIRLRCGLGNIINSRDQYSRYDAGRIPATPLPNFLGNHYTIMEIDNGWAAEPSSREIPMSSVERIPISLDHQPKPCFDCDLSSATSFCPKCNQVFCDECWQDQSPHLKGRPGHDRFLLDGSRAEEPSKTL